MTDTANQTTKPAGKVANAKGGKAGSNPLDALEELLKNAKTKGAAGKGKASAKSADQAPEGPSEQELLAKVELKKQALKQEEQVLVQQQIAAMQQEAVTAPQSQARQQQSQEKEQKKKKQVETSEKYQIRQLDHTKI